MPENIIKKKGLGRGLTHLFGEAEAAYRGAVEAGAASTASPRTLPVEFLRPGKFQPRRNFDETALVELAGSIRTHGVLQPILVRPVKGETDAYEIIAGERRWRAAQMAELHRVPVMVQSLDDSQTLEIALIENLQRQDLTAVEEAEGYQRLIDEFDHSHGQIGMLVGKSRSHIANCLRLLTLPDTVKRMVQDGLLSAGHARALIGLPDIEPLARMVVDRGLSVRETERLANRAKSPAEPGGTAAKAPPRKDADLLKLERDLEESLGLKVSIESRGGSGTLTIGYRTLDQLDEILERLKSGN